MQEKRFTEPIVRNRHGGPVHCTLENSYQRQRQIQPSLGRFCQDPASLKSHRLPNSRESHWRSYLLCRYQILSAKEAGTNTEEPPRIEPSVRKTAGGELWILPASRSRVTAELQDLKIFLWPSRLNL